MITIFYALYYHFSLFILTRRDYTLFLREINTYIIKISQRNLKSHKDVFNIKIKTFLIHSDRVRLEIGF